jgi:glycosyltransferase involved in cell wall biosynthesis
MRNKKSTVTVIVPTLQEQDFIENILSRLKRVKPPIEVIVVDGGSQDKTVELAKPFADKVYQIQQRGISKGRNYGAKKASGDILVFLDTDVTFPLKFVERVIETFKDPTVAGATCNIMPLQFHFGATVFFKVYNLALRVFTKFNPHSRGEFFAVRKKAFHAVNGFNETMPCLEDHDLANRLSKLGRFVFISDLTVYESMRRFRKLGFWHVIATWFVDYTSFVFIGKTVSQVWKPIR